MSLLKTAAVFPILFVISGLELSAADTFMLRAGSTLTVRIGTTLSSKESQTGDTFTGDVAEPVIYGGEEVVPTGSTVQGRIDIKEPARSKGIPEIRLTIEAIITPAGTRYAISGQNAPAAGQTKMKGQAESPKGTEKTGNTGPSGDQSVLFAVVNESTNSDVPGVTKKRHEILVSPGTELTFTAKGDLVGKKVSGPR